MAAPPIRLLWARRWVLLGQAQHTRSWTGHGRKLPDLLRGNESLFGLPCGLWFSILERCFYVYFPLQTPDKPGGRKESYPPTGCTCFLLQPRLQLVRCSNRTVSKTSSTSDLVLEVHLIFPLELLLQPTLLTLCLVYLLFPSFIKTEKQYVAALYFQLNSYCST